MASRPPKRRAAESRARSDAIDQAFASLRRVMGDMFGRMRRAMADRGVSPPQFFVLRLLHEGKASTPNELADALCVTPANITGLVAKLERSGFVVRSRDRRDRRVVRLRLTPKAVKGMEAVQKAARESAAEAFHDWSARDLAQLKSLLDRLADAGPAGTAKRAPVKRASPRQRSRP